MARSIPSSTVILCVPQSMGLDPDSFARRCGAADRTLSAPLIIVTPAHDPRSEAEYQHLGYTTHLRSPLDPDTLFNALHAIASPPVPVDALSFRDFYQRNSQVKHGVPVLLADGNETNRRIISRILEFGGHQIHLAKDGDEALNLLGQRRYGIVVLDMNMPLMGGLDVLRVYRATQREQPMTPVIILSANATVEAIQEANSAGADLHLSKPVDALTLLNAVDRLVQGTSDHRPGANPEPALPSSLPASGSPGQLPLPAAPASDSSASSTPPSSSKCQVAQQILKRITLDHLALLGRDQPGFLPGVIHGFLAESGQLVQALAAALQRGDYTGSRELAHTLKGSTGNIGAEALHGLCRELMALPPAHWNPAVAQRGAELIGCFEQTQSALLNHLAFSRSNPAQPPDFVPPTLPESAAPPLH